MDSLKATPNSENTVPVPLIDGSDSLWFIVQESQ